MATYRAAIANVDCQYYRACRRFLQSLKLPEDAFRSDTKFDMCFCTTCRDSRGDLPVYTRGRPPKLYTLPFGWVRFALNVLTTDAKGVKIDSDYHRAFRGVHPNGVFEILQSRRLFSPVVTTNLEEEKQNSEKAKKTCVTPSIRYATQDIYSVPEWWNDNETGVSYEARMVFQVWIRPGSYTIGPQTIGANYKVDRHFTNDELVWTTTNQDDVIPYGLLIQLTALPS
ncbi:neuralized-like protein 4 [Saccoglossus kowalevskii]